jgi:preprotein translocase subunit SecG
MLYTLFMILHVIISLLLVVVVLMQSGKGGGLAGAFGGGGGMPQQMLGSRTLTTALTKVTVYLAIGFFMTSAILFMLTADRVSTSSAIGDALEEGTLTSDIALPVGDDAPLVTDTPAADAPVPTESDEETSGGGE